jgi:predicted O-methyltransferase YrrM
MIKLDDVDLIADLCAKLPTDKCLRIVDLGAGVGCTALAAFCGLPNRDVVLISVDRNWGALKDTQTQVEAIDRLPQWRGIISPAVEAAEFFGDRTVDFLMVDTLHYYESTRAEIEAWLPKLTPGGIIWVHDYIFEHKGVQQAVDALVAEGYLRPYKVQGAGWAGSPVWRRL